MKNLLSIFLISFIAFSGFSQVPQKFSYQTVIRNSSNQLLAGQTVGIKISILQGSANGSAVYAETHTPQTNANGLASLEIGGGSLLSGNFENINWANGPFFVKTETDPNGGNNYTITNTSQLLSVPYALYSNSTSSSVSSSGDTLFIGNQSYIIPGISAANNTGGQTGLTHTCGAISVHNPDKTYGSMTDQEGNVYKTIVIGTQEWMAENLKTSTYRNGNAITNVTDNAQWFILSTEAWASYNNDSQFYCPYGKLYNWYAVADPRNLCPAGWHVPSDTEWATLMNYLGGDSIAGGKMKTLSAQYWNSPNTNATNESGFSGIPSGYRNFDGTFGAIGFTGNWWTSSEINIYNSWYHILFYNDNNSQKYYSNKRYGASVRCLRD